LHAFLEEALGVQAVDGVVAVTAIEEMVGDHLADAMVVHADEGQRAAEERRPQLDRGQPGGGDHVGHLLRERAGQDAVAVPVFEPGRRAGFERAQFDEAGPRTVGGDVAADAGEQFPRVGAGGLDEKRDAGRTTAAVGHGVGCDDEKPEVACTISVVTGGAKMFRLRE
jgi:hypothetical protein